MASIKVGFIGLSATGWARSAHLPYLKESGKYEIVAVCNSSVRSSGAAIKQFGLSPLTKAYGDPEEIAKDPNVELVVCSVRVDKHLPTVAPSLKAGKNVFVEWPLGKSAEEARQLLQLKNEGRVKTAVVGLQARQDPMLNKIKSLIESGAIGKVLSSTWAAQALNGGPTATEGAKYLGDKEVGGNLVTIHLGHAVDYVQHVLGYGFVNWPHGTLKNRRTRINLVDADGKIIKENVPKTADDTIFVVGTLSTGVPLSMTLRGGMPFKGTPGLDWRIYGETGELRVTASGPFLQIGYPDTKVEVHNFEHDKLEEVEIPRDDLDVEGGDAYGGFAARNVGRLYRELAKGQVNCSFEDAVERHEFLETLYFNNKYWDG